MNPAAQNAIQVCQPGFDVRNCPDWAYLFNSNWPSLAIAQEQTIPNPSTSITITHNLGYPPLALLWSNFTGTGSYGRVHGGSVTNTTFSIGKVGSANTLTIRLFNIDVSKEAAYPLPQSAQAKLPYNDQFGIKQAKSGRSITSRNLNDFIIHSRAQSPAVLQVATEKGPYFTTSNPGSQYSGPWIVYPLKTSYVPWVFGLQRTSTSPLTYQAVGINGIQLINNQLVFPLLGASGGSLIILRDPLFYPNTVSVVY